MLQNLTAIIPFRDGHATLSNLISSLPNDLPVVVVDDGSAIPYLVPQKSNIKVIRLPQRGYFSGAVNTGIQACNTDVLVLNQDVWLDGDRWQELLQANRETFAMIGDGVMEHPFLPNGYVQGTFMFMRRDALDKVGLLNEKDYPLWGATAEWQVRAARLGFSAKPVRVREYGMGHYRGDQPYGSSIAAALKERPQDQSWLIRTPPMISVIITCYNYGRYLADAVNSLLGGETCLGMVPPQTFQSFEIIIVDDGSKDNSAAIGKALADPNKGIRFISRTNGGSSASANTGIAAAMGKWITVLDADDMMSPTRLETMFRLAEQNPHSVIYDDVLWMEEGPKGWQPTRVYELSPYDFNSMLTKNAMHKGIMYPKAAWKEVGGYPERMRDGREDWGFNVGLGVKGYCGVHIPQALYLYRRHDHNRTKRNTTMEMREYFMEQLQSLFPNIYAGDRPMGCCGKKSNGNGAGLAARGGRLMAEPTATSSGMELLEYQLQRAGSTVYTGAVTKQTYVFGGSRKRGYVDSRDVPAFLALMEGRNYTFARASNVPAAAASQTPAPKSPEPELVQASPFPVVMEPAGVSTEGTGHMEHPEVRPASASEHKAVKAVKTGLKAPKKSLKKTA